MKYILLVVLGLFLFSCNPEVNTKSMEAYEQGIVIIEKDGSSVASYESAHTLFAKAVALDPNNTLAAYWKATAEIHMGSFGSALETCNAALNNPSVAGTSWERRLLAAAGISSYGAGDTTKTYFEKALLLCEEALDKDSNNEQLILEKAVLLCYMGRNKEADEYLSIVTVGDGQMQTELENVRKGLSDFNVGTFLDGIYELNHQSEL